MTNIKFIDSNGDHHEVEALDGASIMETAVDNGIEGIIGDCGGLLSCATCHCYLDDKALEVAPPISEDEEYMLDTVLERTEKSRLGCQVALTEEMDGITVTVPESQY